MSGTTTCFVCKSSLESYENVVSLWSAQRVNPSSNANGFASEPWLCHHSCFICSVCSLTLEEKTHTYSVSIDKKLVCSKHYCCQNSKDRALIQALNDFKARSLALKATLEKTEASENGFENKEGISSYNCSCREPKFVKIVTGYVYRVECIEKDCPMRDFFTKKYEHRFKNYCDFGSSRVSGHVTSVAPEEFYRQFFYGVKHWNYCVKEDDVGAILVTMKPESIPQSKGYFRIMVRSSYYLIFGLLSLLNQHGGLSSREEVVQFITQQVGIKSTMKLITTPSAPAEILKMDNAFIKQAYKFGVIYMKENQQTEEELFGNETHSKAFDEFLDLLGERIRLRGFDKYRAGLDGNNDLTGTHSVYTKFADIEIMFHVSTLLPFEECDSQKLQRKRHIGNDIMCIIFMEGTNTKFAPDCIKSNFLHSFIIVQVDVESNPNLYTVSVVSRNSVLFYDPALYERHVFEKNDEFREWILKKLIQGEQACHRGPNFAKLHARTRTLIMEGLLNSIEMNSHSSPTSSPSAAHEHHMTVGQISRDFSSVSSSGHDRGDTVAFLVDKKCFIGVKSVMSVKSNVFHEMLSQDLGHANTVLPSTKASPALATVLKRTASWRSSHVVQTGLRSGKVNLEKMRRCKSLNEGDDPYVTNVTLESITDLENKKDNETSAISQLLPQEVIIVKQFESNVFETLLEFLHIGSCDLVPSLLPGLLSAAQYYEVEELYQVCVESMKENGLTAQTNTVSD